MRQSKSKAISKSEEYRFRSSIEGCIPDLIEGDGRMADPCPSMYRDDIRDYVADRACDTFPNVPAADRATLVDSVTDYFCGKEDKVEEGPILLSEMFPLGVDPELSDDDKIRLGEAEAGCGWGMPEEDVEND